MYNKSAKYVIIFLSLLGLMAYSMNNAINAPTYHLDGAFQTASSLFRLNAGQFPGKDFFPYLGLGPVYILYPLFWLFGENLAASVTSAHFITLITFVLSISLLFNLIFRQKIFLNSLVIASLCVIIVITFFNFSHLGVPGLLAYSISPGNSLRPLRCFLPFLAILFYALIFQKIENTKLKYSLCAVFNGFMLIWSNDYAFTTAFLFLILVLAESVRSHDFNVWFAVKYLFWMSLAAVSLYTLATCGHPLGMLKYNFLDVAKDQWWYFALYGETFRIFQPAQLLKIFVSKNLLLDIPILIAAWIIALKAKSAQWILVCWIGIALFAGGLIASAGGHIEGYFFAFSFWSKCTLFLSLAYLALKRMSEVLNDLQKTSYSRVILLLAVVASTLLSGVMWMRYRSNLIEAEHDKNRFYVKELGGYLDKQWSDYIDLIRKTDSKNVIEEYWGIWSATKKIFPPWPVDSVISALGTKRELAEKMLKNADFITSTKYTVSTQWQPWNMSQNYWFYEEIMKNRRPYFPSPTTIVWARGANQLGKSVVGVIDQDNKQIIFKDAEPGFYELQISYHYQAIGKSLLMVRNNISYAMDAAGYVSLDPKATSVKMPVYLYDTGRNVLDFKVIGSTDFNLNISDCHVTLLPKTVLEELHK
jgi:hypothetical protein